VVRLFQSNEAAAEALVHAHKQQLDGLLRQMEVLMGRYPEAELETGSDLPPIPSEIPAGLPAEIVSRRPDVASAERRLAASGARLSQAKASLYPRISLTASGGTSSEELVHLLDGRFWVWSFFANLLQPVFQGGRLVAQVDLAEANLEESTATFLKTTLGAYAEVELALSALEHLGRHVEALERATEEAEQAERIAEERYAAGLDGPSTLLDAQRTSLLVASQLLQARRERLDARVNLHLALGGGFEEER
jgi:NodT family efflux transporter outer membrane factor (OMF) lipoprotein